MRLSQAKVRSTTQRRGRTSKPLAVSERLMISIVQSADLGQSVPQLGSGIAAVGEDVAQPGIERRGSRRGRRRRRRDPGCRRHERRRRRASPAVSVTMWRLRPLIFLPAS